MGRDYGRDKNAAESRLGLLAIQRLHREADSSHGDVIQLGARAKLRLYGTTCNEAERYFQSIYFPVPGQASPLDRGGYPVRSGDRALRFTPNQLREAETEVQGWIQFETVEYILNRDVRDRIPDLMMEQGRSKACGFVGPFNVVLLREGEMPRLNDASNELIRVASKRGLYNWARCRVRIDGGSQGNRRMDS